MSETDFKKYECVICGFIYDEAEGLPDDGIPPGTRWDDLPEALSLDGVYPLDVKWHTDGVRDIVLSSRLDGNEVIYVPEPRFGLLTVAMLGLILRSRVFRCLMKA